MTKPNAPLQPKEIKQIIDMRDGDDLSFTEIARRLGRDRGVVRKLYEMYVSKPEYHLDESIYPRYDNPIEDEGDALILPDPEIPFHNAEFINRCIDLAKAWKIDHLIVPGDLVHFASMSGWNPNWEPDDKNDISDRAEKKLLKRAEKWPAKYRNELISELVELAPVTEGGLSAELAETKKQLAILTQAFKTATLDMGNHEGRLLATFNSPLAVGNLTDLLCIGSWRVAPYYFSLLHTANGTYRLTHPKPYADATPVKLCAQFQQHILMGHSHKVWQTFDASGQYYAWHIGCCVDESRLAYAGQRDRSAQLTPHMLGAVIVRDGFPYMLNEHIDWKFYMSK